MTARMLADTNLFVYAESQDQDKSSRAIEIIRDAPVISTQVINETVSVSTRKHGFLAMVKRYAHLSDGHVSIVVASMNAKIFGSV